MNSPAMISMLLLESLLRLITLLFNFEVMILFVNSLRVDLLFTLNLMKTVRHNSSVD